MVGILHISWTVSLAESAITDFQVDPVKEGVERIIIKDHASAGNTTSLRHDNFHVDFPLCLVHVGKAAGSSVSCGLGFTYADCEGMPRDPLPHTHFFHMKRNQCAAARVKPKTYVVTLRNPLTRLQSWFDFEKDIVPKRGKNNRMQEQIRKQRAMLFQECYTTFEKLVLEGLVPLKDSAVAARQPKDMTCPERAWAAVLGTRAFSYHEWYNYEYYWLGIQQQPDNEIDFLKDPGIQSWHPNLFALRTEFLAEDWKTLSEEPLFRPVNRRGKMASASNNETTHTPLTFLLHNDQARAQLCDALCREIQYYKLFVTAAQNLNAFQREATLKDLTQYCPRETSLQVRNDCPGTTPEFLPMVVSERQYRGEVKKRLFTVSGM